MNKFFKEQTRKLVQTIAKSALNSTSLSATRNIDLYLHVLLQELEDKQNINDPDFFVGELRASFMPYYLKIKEIKQCQGKSDEPNRQFEMLIDTLKKSVPGLPASTALEIARIADGHLGNTDYQPSLGTDLAWIFNKGSALSRRGRILYSTVRFMRPKQCVEAGTFFGMSALYLAFALERYCEQSCFHTIEISNTFYSVASKILESRFPQTVKCYCGPTQNMLPQISGEIGEIDFFFHDNGHSYDDYLRDFGVALEYLKPGSIVMFDDIHWKDPVNLNVDHRCYEGWLEIVSHPRVRRAIEIDSEMGLILMA